MTHEAIALDDVSMEEDEDTSNHDDTDDLDVPVQTS